MLKSRVFFFKKKNYLFVTLYVKKSDFRKAFWCDPPRKQTEKGEKNLKS